MKQITRIPAVRQAHRKWKVAAYCRVSTLMHSQETSIESQRIHYEMEIQNHPDWECAGIFLEAGVSGTSANQRPQLQLLLQLCREGGVDLIMTKSLSRFSRNTTECLEMVRILSQMGVFLCFEKEQIDTRMMDSEFMLSILACFAEEESHSISENLKWSIRKRFEKGSYQQALVPYGYEKKNGVLTISEKQAAVVREIFSLALDGNGGVRIAQILNRNKVKSPEGLRWQQSTIQEILQNPFYIGDLLLQKTFVDEHFQQRRNRGELSQFYQKDHHEAIIPREVFTSVRLEMKRRRKMKVQVIEAIPAQDGMLVPGNAKAAKRRVAAYCRVSTDSEEQETSYEAQCKHYWEYITSHPDWELAGIYADEGITGTSTKKREQFNRMLADSEAGKIDMIITKSISRWARNTIDSLKSIRKLKDLNIPVQFEKENINTLDAKGEIMITILSSLAQQESDSISKNVRLGIQYQMQQGKGRLNTARFLGLTKIPGKEGLFIVPQEADLVRRIYREYLEGYSPALIAKHLTNEKIKTPADKNQWYASTISSILQNEKYRGDLLLQKYYVSDFLSHKIVKNKGQLPQYFVEDNHLPIVPKKIFERVQTEHKRRSLCQHDPTSLRYGSEMALQGRLVCGICGRTLKQYRNAKNGDTDWRCRARAYEKRSSLKEVPGRCPCRNVKDREIKEYLLTSFQTLPKYEEELRRRKENLQEEQKNVEDANEIRRAELQFQEMQIRMMLELIDGGTERPRPHSYPDYCREEEEFFERTRSRWNLNFFKMDSAVPFPDTAVTRYLDHIVVMEEGYEIHLKCGLVL